MSDTSMVERVARAICCPNGCAKPDRCRSDFKATEARAAIAAMREPSEAALQGLARDIIMWWGMDRPTGGALYLHLNRGGRVVPAWLKEIIPERDHVPPKAAVAMAVHRAIIDAALNETEETR